METSLPKVSVIITTYNRKEIVGEAIQGVSDQNYPNIEIIVVDDYSTDGTEEYFKTHWTDKVKYVRHKKNQGVQFASNTGYSHASGKYLSFIGDDDLWKDQNKISKQVDLLEKDTVGRYGVATCAVQEFGGPGATLKPRKWPRNLRAHLMAGNGIIYGSAAMIRREAFVACGGFDPHLVKGTDSDVFRRIVLNGWDVLFDPTPMINYRIGDGRMTTLNLLGLRRTISAQAHVLQKYSYLWHSYKRAAKNRMAFQASAYLQLYKLTSSETAKQGALDMTWRSMSFSKIWFKVFRDVLLLFIKSKLK